MSISPAAPRQSPALRPQAPAPQFGMANQATEFAAFQRAPAAPAAFQHRSAPSAFGSPMEETKLPCRTLDAKLYRDSAEVNVSIVCSTGHAPTTVVLFADDEDIIDEGEVDGENYVMHEYVAHGECPNCGMIFHNSASRSVPATR